MKISLSRFKKITTGICFILYPLFAGFAFVVHPDFFNILPNEDITQKINQFHQNTLLHFGHFLMWLAVPLLIVIAVHFMQTYQTTAKWWIFWGGCLAVFGAVVLATDKAALCFVPAAFDTLPEAQFQSLFPGIEALFQYQGWLWILWLLPLLPVGFILQSIGLLKTPSMPKAQSIPMLIGSILMANPDIDLIGFVATVVLAAGFIPYGLSLIKNKDLVGGVL